MDSISELDPGLMRQRRRPFTHKGRYKMEVVEQVDRISDLPDHITALILSFLRTEEAVRTCILSSRWSHLWKGITRISLHGGNSDPDKFSNLIEHVLRNCSSANFLEFDLACPGTVDLPRLNAWISCVLSHKVDKLRLWIDQYSYELPEPPLPQCVLSCNRLVVLKLESCFDIHIPESIDCFPFLKSLDIDVVFPAHNGVVNRLLSCCPVLEELDLYGFLDSPEVLNIDISSSTLRKLSLGLKDEGDSLRNEFNIVINTPNLECLSIEDDSFARCVVKNLAQVYKVEVTYHASCPELLDPEHFNRLLELLKGTTATEVLILDWNTLLVLGSTPSYTWPTFPFLTTLILQICAFPGFPQVLHGAPCLENLIFDLEGIYGGNLYQWTPPDIVPSCLLEYLKEVGITYFQGNKEELDAVEYLLNNARVLECMMIGRHPDYDVNAAVEKVLTFTRASKTCEVQIYESLKFEFDSFDRIALWSSDCYVTRGSSFHSY